MRITVKAALAGFVLLAAASSDASAQSEVETLKKQVESLQAVVKDMQKRLEKYESAAQPHQQQALQQEVQALKTKLEATQALAMESVGQSATQDDILGVRSDLENFRDQWQREHDRKMALSTRSLTIGGVIQANYSYSEYKTRTATVNGRNNTFDIGAAILSFTGNLYKDYEEGRDLTYNLRFGSSPQQTTNNSFLNLLDANITYSLLPTTALEMAKLEATFGQQLLPFGLEVPATEELKPTIRNAQFTTGLGLNLRQIGLIVRGDLRPTVDYGYNYRAPLIQYAIGVVTGAGPNMPDNNSDKDLIARTAVTIPSDYNSLWRQLTIGSSFYRGRQNTSLATADRKLSGTGPRNRYGLDVSYNHHPIGVTFEYVRGSDGVTLGTTPEQRNPRTIRSEGYTGAFFYNFGEQFVRGYRNQGRFDDWWPKSYQPFVRYDSFDPDDRKAGDQVGIVTLGFNAFFAETTKFQLNYNIRLANKENRGVGNELLGQLQFGF